MGPALGASKTRDSLPSEPSALLSLRPAVGPALGASKTRDSLPSEPNMSALLSLCEPNPSLSVPNPGGPLESSPAVGTKGTGYSRGGKHVAPTTQPTAAKLPEPVPPTTTTALKVDKFHEEIWMSGALTILKGGTPNASGRWLNKMVEQAKQYRGMFTGSGCPIAIFTAPAQGLLTQEKALEVPAWPKNFNSGCSP